MYMYMHVIMNIHERNTLYAQKGKKQLDTIKWVKQHNMQSQNWLAWVEFEPNFPGPSTCNLDWHYVITQYKRGARMDGLLGARMDGQWVV